MRLATLMLLALLASAGPFPAGLAEAAEPLPKKLEGVTVDEHLGKKIDLDVQFVDQGGKRRLLRDYFRDGKPVVLTLNYYRCKMLCNLQLNALTAALRALSWTPGREFRVVTVSIDSREGPKLAGDKRQSHLQALGRGDVDWSFLTGRAEDIRRLAASVGFRFAYDRDLDQFAHPAVIQFISPQGKITRYIYGIEYRPRDLKFALMEASEGKVGTTVDRVILSCFHYDSSAGRYAPFALGIMRLGGALTLILLSLLLTVLWLRERRRRTTAASGERPVPREAS